MDDELNQDPATTTPAEASAPAPPPAPAPSLGQQLEAAGADAGSGSPAGSPAGPAAAADWQGVRDFARAQGVELPFADDAAALQNLLQAYRSSQERNYYADLGQRVAPHADQFTAFLQHQQAQVQAQQQVPPAWKPPTFRKEWLQQVERDPETGALRARAGYDPSLPEKVQAYADWRDRFLDSPDAVIGPLVEDRARAIVREEQAAYQQQSLANDLVCQDAGWLFQQGSNPQDRRLSPAGQLYAATAKRLWEGGLRDVAEVHTRSREAVENAVLRQQLAAGRPAAAGTTAPLQAGQAASVGGPTSRPASSGSPAAPAASQRGLSLRERLAQSLDRIAVPDELE